MLPHILHLAGPVEGPEEPLENVYKGDEDDEHEPEPDEDEDLFVEEVDGQRALNDVVMNTWLMTYFEFAQRDTREAFRLAPFLPADQPFHHVGAVPVILDAQKDLH